MFSSEACEIFKNTYFVEHLWTAASEEYFVEHSCVLEPIRPQCTLSLPPENNRTPFGFPIFLWGLEKVHWERIV